MSIQRSAILFNRLINPLIKGIGFIGGSGLMFMMVLVACDVILRFFNRPIPGAYELVEYSMALTVSFGVTVCAHQGGHIAVDILTNSLRKTAKQALACLMSIIVIVYTLPIMWMTTRQIQDTYESGITSAVLHIAVYPFTAIVAFSFAMTSIVFIANMLNLMAEIGERWTP